MLAAVYCGIIKPEFKPTLGVKYGGKPLCPETKRYILRSEILPSSDNAIAI